MAKHVIPWTMDPRLSRTHAFIGNAVKVHGADSPQAEAARTERRVVRAELAIEDLINNTPAPTAEQIERLRRLLPPVSPQESA